jgi:carbonic anhydrase/acetyltransferase-like protein (isoleucine patch superfamily)
MIIKVRDTEPKLAENVFIAPGATVIGNVSIGENSSVLFGAVIRGDVNAITIGKNCNVQDNSTIHATYQKTTTTLEDNVSIGHNVILHGCHIGENTLIGMGSIVMDNAKIGKNSIVGAGSLVTEGKEFEEGSLIVGRPAKAIRKLSEEEKEMAFKASEYYLHYKTWYEDMEIIAEGDKDA